ncbi:hypothetical protein [Patulibacter sp. SYSU D01012]|uniref:hypothetical protein n=1 Tax=Patulibacter sp. SYSU D01012 TaxID=2817381 RepID=UPI001B311AD3|nr:hypothetical protein [Patulibacter sp. SYSU D01012]
MTLAIVLGVLAVASVAAFVATLRLARRRTAQEPRRRRVERPAEHVDRLTVGAEVAYDDQSWDVRGVQRVTPADGPAYALWHLDHHGQSGLLVRTEGDDERVLFAVRAERPETLDPLRPPVRFRDHDWTPEDPAVAGPQPTATEGRRRRVRDALVALPDAAVERVVLVRDGLPDRRLLFERAAGEATWNAWVGALVPVRMVDVYPPYGDGAAPDGVPHAPDGAPPTAPR